jgi:hypothetical protein
MNDIQRAMMRKAAKGDYRREKTEQEDAFDNIFTYFNTQTTETYKAYLETERLASEFQCATEPEEFLEDRNSFHTVFHKAVEAIDNWNREQSANNREVALSTISMLMTGIVMTSQPIDKWRCMEDITSILRAVVMSKPSVNQLPEIDDL